MVPKVSKYSVLLLVPIYLSRYLSIICTSLGTYVIMVQDVTEPPFLGQRLEPGFLEVKLALPKKSKKVVKKEKGPRYENCFKFVAFCTYEFCFITFRDIG